MLTFTGISTITSQGNIASLTGSITAATQISAGGDIISHSNITAKNLFVDGVGIGTKTPTTELDVVGDINFSGMLYQNGTELNVDDADADPTNEINNSVNLNGTNLEISDAGGTIVQDLSPLVDDADADPTNELQDLSNLVLKSNVLELNNTTPFTPDADYEPATKKYVDDNAAEVEYYSAHRFYQSLGGYVVFVRPGGQHGLVTSMIDLPDDYRYEDAQYAIDRYLNYSSASPNHCSGWRLPTRREAEYLYYRKNDIGGFDNREYWTSTPALL